MSQTIVEFAAALFGDPGDAVDLLKPTDVEACGRLLNETEGLVVRDLELHHANPRLMRRDQPATYEPGDVAGVRFAHCAGMAMHAVGAMQAIRGKAAEESELSDDEQVLLSIGLVGLGEYDAVARAVPFFVPAGAAVALAGSHPPDPGLELRLPYERVLVLFGAPLRFEAATSWLEAAMAPRDLKHVLAIARVHMPNGADFEDPDLDRDLMGAMAVNGGALHGVCLFADEDDRAHDLALWLFSSEMISDGVTVTSSMLGALHRGAFSPIARSAAALCAWGDWVPPDESYVLPEDLTAGEVKDFVNKGKWRRSEARGGPLGVRVLDVKRAAARVTDSDAGSSGRTVSPHSRRGHFRRVRVGPRTDWHYEARWIPWTLVNASEGDVDFGRVYRLPEPPDPAERPADV